MSIATMKRLTIVLPVLCLFVAITLVCHQYWRLATLQARYEALRSSLQRELGAHSSDAPHLDHDDHGRPR